MIVEDPKPTHMKELQLTQNRLLRALNNSKIKDKFNLLSVNQLAARIKLLEVWKAVHVEGYAIVLWGVAALILPVGLAKGGPGCFVPSVWVHKVPSRE